MKKTLLPFVLSLLAMTSAFGQNQRFINEVFTTLDIDTGIVYSQNYSVIAAGDGVPYVLTGSIPQAPPLAFDFYQPLNDTMAERPLIIMLHTGTFLPIIYNGNPTGSRFDFATSQICQSYAKRGYVVANLEYRLGWNPLAPTQADRAASLMKAVYRAIQDTKSAVRYFRKDYENGNTFGIDTSKIILCGQGSGGWVALGYASIDKLIEIQLPKFLDAEANPLVDPADIGDWDGIGGTNNVESNIGYSNNVHMVLSMGGGMGDLSWLEAGDVPMVAVHCPTDPVATFTTGDVSVAQIGIVTTDISGGYDVLKKANQLGNNTIMNPVNDGNDPYTLAARAASLRAQGLSDIGGTVIGAPTDNLFPYLTGNPFEGSPWDFWDSTTTVAIAVSIGLPASSGTDAHVSAKQQNPNVSIPKAMAYIDTTLGFFCRRIVRVTNLDGITNVDEINNSLASVQIYPNPASENTSVSIKLDSEAKVEMRMLDISGKVMLAKNFGSLVGTLTETINTSDLSSGIYLVELTIGGNKVTKRLVIE
jgi:hypothetical protein